MTSGSAGHLDVRILRSIPTPVADCLVGLGCRTAGEVLAKPAVLQDALKQLRTSAVEQKAAEILGSCRREVQDSHSLQWGASALTLLQQSEASLPVALPCSALGQLLGSGLKPGGGLLEVCGLPGTGKTQFCLQLCAAAQIPHATESRPVGAVYVDSEGSFVPRRYAQVCCALLSERRGSADTVQQAQQLELVLRNLHVCRAFDATELYATVKHLGSFLKAHPEIRVLVVDSVAFCFRHEFADNAAQRARVLADIAATLRRYGAEFGIVVALTNHMTTRFDRGPDGAAWLAPALGESWAHQASTQLRLERSQSGLGRATLTKSVSQASGRSCFYRVTEAGLRDADPEPPCLGI